jgi:hypothetical protein
MLTDVVWFWGTQVHYHPLCLTVDLSVSFCLTVCLSLSPLIFFLDFF